MPIPVAQLPDAAERPVGTPYEQPRETPDLSGAERVSKVAALSDAIATKARNDALAAIVADRSASFDEIAIASADEFRKEQGLNAVGKRNDAVKKLTEARAKLAASIEDPHARRVFDAQSRDRTNSVTSSIYGHASTQMLAVQSESFQRKENTSLAAVQRAAHIPEQADKETMVGLAVARSRAKTEGRDDAEATQEYLGKAAAARLKALIDMPFGQGASLARAFFRKEGTEEALGQLAPRFRHDIDTLLGDQLIETVAMSVSKAASTRAGVDMQKARGLVDGFISRGEMAPAQGPKVMESIGARAREIKSAITLHHEPFFNRATAAVNAGGIEAVSAGDKLYLNNPENIGAPMLWEHLQRVDRAKKEGREEETSAQSTLYMRASIDLARTWQDAGRLTQVELQQKLIDMGRAVAGENGLSEPVTLPQRRMDHIVDQVRRYAEQVAKPGDVLDKTETDLILAYGRDKTGRTSADFPLTGGVDDLKGVPARVFVHLSDKLREAKSEAKKNNKPWMRADTAKLLDDEYARVKVKGSGWFVDDTVSKVRAQVDPAYSGKKAVRSGTPGAAPSAPPSAPVPLAVGDTRQVGDKTMVVRRFDADGVPVWGRIDRRAGEEEYLAVVEARRSKWEARDAASDVAAAEVALGPARRALIGMEVRRLEDEKDAAHRAGEKKRAKELHEELVAAKKRLEEVD